MSDKPYLLQAILHGLATRAEAKATIKGKVDSYGFVDNVSALPPCLELRMLGCATMPSTCS